MCLVESESRCTSAFGCPEYLAVSPHILVVIRKPLSPGNFLQLPPQPVALSKVSTLNLFLEVEYSSRSPTLSKILPIKWRSWGNSCSLGRQTAAAFQ